jgi:capsular polysaccharide biosynthesis protein
MREEEPLPTDPRASTRWPDSGLEADGSSDGATSTAADPVRSEPPSPEDPPHRSSEEGTPLWVGPLEAAIHHPLLTILPVLLALAAGLAVGLVREEVFTAKARVSVGRVDVPAYTLQDVVIGNQALAAGYARVVSTAPVISRASTETGIPPSEVGGRLSGTPVPGSTLIEIDAEGDSSEQAVKLANTGARVLIGYVESVNRDQGPRDLLGQFREARLREARLRRELAALERSHAGVEELERARVALDAAGLRAANLANVYRGLNSDPASGSPLLLIAPAATASSDFWPVLERALLIALAAGLVVGFGLALLRANAEELRALRW